MQCFKKSYKFLNKSVSLLLVILIVMTSMVSLAVTSISVTAASDSTGATVANEVMYLNTSSNTAWNPSGSNKLWALFANSSGTIINNTPVAFSSVGTNLYSATAPAGATSVQVILTDKNTFPATVPAIGYERVFFDNSGANWSTPKIYCWSDSVKPNWNASPSMMKLGSTNYYYYDVDTTKYNKLIFHNGSDTQSSDLTLPSLDCSIYSWSSKSWNSVPYYLKSTVVSFTGRKAGANEIYANSKDEGVLSKYPYGARKQNTADWTTVYLYNENWTTAYVVYDYSDPYKETIAMTPVTGEPGVYSASVPKYASVKFKPNKDNDTAASIVSEVNTSLSEPCFKMTSSTSYWCELSSSQGAFSHYSVGNTFEEGIYGAKATYFDYLSDTELTNGWRNAIQAGTGFSGSSDDWFPFDNWNNVIKDVANSNSSWTTPLYVGNFVNTKDGPYATSQHGARGGNGYYSEIANLTRFNYAANNSNALKSYNYSIRGLAGKTLNNGNITTPNGTLMPYFDNEKYKSSNAVKIIDSYFPFRTTDKGNGITEYSFNSNGATDNVYFTWNNNVPTAVNYGAGTSYGVKDGIQYFMNPNDGYASGYGIFPFNTVADNNTSSSSSEAYVFYYDVPSTYNMVIFRNKDNHSEQYPQSVGFSVTDGYCYNVSNGSWSAYTGSVKPSTSVSSGYKRIYVTTSSDGWLSNTPDIYLYNSSNTSQNTGWNNQTLMTRVSSSSSGAAKPLNYGFGIRLDIDFFVPANGKFANGEAVKFKFEGDDDLWVYITDSKGNSQLVLDMGGAHKMAAGEINFNTMKSTVKYSGEVNLSGDIKENWAINLQDNYVSNIGFEANDGSTASTGTYNCLDPNETYHMTVFYMERGLIESNFKVSFTMSPATNDLRVNKEVNTADVNPGLEEAMSDADFTFTPYQNGNAFTSSSGDVNKEYTLNNVLDTKYYLDDNGSFALTDGDTADFDKQFDIGSKMQIKESVASNVRYDTTWEVINRKTGATIKDINNVAARGTGLNTKEFLLQDPTNKLSNAMLQVNYVNTPQTANVNLTKAVVNENGNATTSNDIFGYTVYVDVTGEGNSYKTYPLQYQLAYDGGTAIFNSTENGYITFKPGEQVTLLNLPVGAKYKIVESVATGYSAHSATITSGGIDVNFSDDRTISGSVVNGSSTVAFTNQLKPTNGVIEATKLLDGEAYSGEKFSFTLSGLGSMKYTENGEVKETHDLSGAMTTTVSSVVDGKVIFNADNSRELLRFGGSDSVGKYRYKLVENAISDTDYTTDSYTYIVEIDVISSNGELIVEDPVYYYIPVNGVTNYSPYLTEANKKTIATFKNYTKTGTVNIVKKGTGSKGDVTLENVEFIVYKSYENGVLSNPLTEANGNTITAVTDADGKATISNIPIFADDSTESDVKYQTYYLAETKGVKGYQLLAKPIEFTLPFEYEAGAIVNGEVQSTAGKTYSLTYAITNGEFTMPETSGTGVNPIFVLGGAIMLAGVCGLLYSKKIKKQKQALTYNA